MKWIRRLIFGRGQELGGHSLGGFAGAGRASVGMLVPEEGPFDRPPEEPAKLDPDALPWELREDDRPSLLLRSGGVCTWWMHPRIRQS